jgi:hypothetical protein
MLLQRAVSHSKAIVSSISPLKHYRGSSGLHLQHSSFVDDIEANFESIRFSQIGSLYFKEDVSEDLRARPLLSGTADPTIQHLAEKYRIGPLADYQWWRGERARMTLDRGPCQSCLLSSASTMLTFLVFLRRG